MSDGSAPAPVVDVAGGHLHAVDVVRVLTVVGVIVVHSTSLTDGAGSDATGGVLVVLHVTREVFLFLSAFVLGYSTRVRPMTATSFWRRRYPLVVVPYAAWSAVYVLTDGHLRTIGHVVATYAVDLTDGGAHFHLYFLLLTLQLYLVFPALFGLLARHRRLHVPLLVASAAFELAFSAAVHYGWRPAGLAVWLDHPGSWLASYELYIAAGLLAAIHFEAVTGWVQRHRRAVVVAFVASVGLGVASYVVDLTVLGYGPLRASEVFQPVIVVEATGAVLAQYAIGLWAVEHLSGRRLRQLERSSDVSFGVYLAHPLVVAAILDAAGAIGVSSSVGRLPSGWVEAMVVVGLVPFVYAITFVGVSLSRRTWLSLAVSGRRRRRSRPSDAAPGSLQGWPSTGSPPAPPLPVPSPPSLPADAVAS